MLQGQRLGWKPLKMYSGFFTSTELTSLHLATVGGTNTTRRVKVRVSHASSKLKETGNTGGACGHTLRGVVAAKGSIVMSRPEACVIAAGQVFEQTKGVLQLSHRIG